MFVRPLVEPADAVWSNRHDVAEVFAISVGIEPITSAHARARELVPLGHLRDHDHITLLKVEHSGENGKALGARVSPSLRVTCFPLRFLDPATVDVDERESRRAPALPQSAFGQFSI